MGGYFSGFFSYFRGREPQTPVKGVGARLKNVAFRHYRGLIGFFVPCFLLTWQGKKGEHHLTVQCMWLMMAWFFLVQPVNVPVTALIPIFILPMAGVISSVETCRSYMNETMVLFILTGMLVLLLNNSGIDRRITLWLLCSGSDAQFSGKRLVYKCTTAAFFLSMFCSRLIVTSTLMQFIAPPLQNLQSATTRYRGSEPDYNEMRYIVCQSIQTASAIGSITLPYTALATLAFRAMFYESAPAGTEYPDIFNYFQYAVYAFPVAFLMHILNFGYHMLLIKWRTKKAMSSSSMSILRSALLKQKESIPKKVTLHEKISVFFTILYLLIAFLRWSKFLDKGWGNFRKEESSPEIPGVKDATVAAMFVIALHTLPKGFGFMKFISAKQKRDLPPVKPESGILFWRFVDRNLNYGYIFMLGCGVALTRSARDSGLGQQLSANLGKNITDNNWNVSILLVCLIAVILANIMSGVAACAIWLPFIINMSWAPDAPDLWQKNMYLGALGVGIGSSFGFMFPFLYTPAYFCHYTAKVPKKKMAIYGVGSAIICMIILWLSLCVWAPFLWDPHSVGIKLQSAGGAAGAAPDVADDPQEAPPG